MKAIIVTHPTQNFKACLFGLDYNKLCLLAELRAKMKGTIKSRFKTIDYSNEIELAKKVDSKVVGMYKITLEQYKHEINTHFEIN